MLWLLRQEKSCLICCIYDASFNKKFSTSVLSVCAKPENSINATELLSILNPSVLGFLAGAAD